MKNKVSATYKGCSSDEITTVIQKMLNDLYLPDAQGNYAATTLDQARDILYGSQMKVYGFLKNLVNQMAEDEALAMLAEIDHKLVYNNADFSLDYDVQSVGSSQTPYTLFVKYGDPDLGYVKFTVNDLSQ